MDNVRTIWYTTDSERNKLSERKTKMDAKQYEKLATGTPVVFNRLNGEVIEGTIQKKWVQSGRNAYLLNHFQPAGKKGLMDIHSKFIELKK